MGKCTKCAYVLQILLFLLARLLDDMSWYDVGVKDEVNVFEGVSVASIFFCILIQMFRKRRIQGWWKILFYRSQLKFFISYSLIATICYLYFKIFGCHTVNEHGSYFFVEYVGCCINVTQIIMTNINYSLICNTKAEPMELFIYEAVIFGEIFYNGDLIIIFIEGMEGKEKDMAIIFISLVLANQVLIMDLIFRAAYEDKEREEQKQEQLLGHDFPHHHYRPQPHPTTIVTQQNSMNYALQIQPSEPKR